MNLFSQLWEKSLIYIKEELNTFQYNMWIKDLSPAFVSDDDFYFMVANEPHKNMMVKKYADVIKDAMKRAYLDIKNTANEDIKIHFILESEMLINKKEEVKEEETEEEPKTEEIRSSGIHIDPNNTFDTFVVGECNRYANQIAINVAKAPGKTFNPLFLYGGPSLGKTHLVHAIGNYILKENPNAKIAYLSSEDFTNEFISSLIPANGKKDTDVREKFRNKYRSVDVLLIDDIQFFQKKEAIQEEFFHTFNALHLLKKQIVVTADKPPKELQDIQNRIISRFDWGVSIDIKPPDYETRVAILMSKAQMIKEEQNFDLPIDNEVFHFIASKITTDIRRLEGSLKKVMMLAELTRADSHIEKIDVKIAEKILADYMDENSPKIITPDYIIDMVCKQFSVSAEEIKGKKKSRDVAFPRQVSMYIMRKISELPYERIADYFSRDHSTVIYAEDKIKQLRKENSEIDDMIEDLIMRIKQ